MMEGSASTQVGGVAPEWAAGVLSTMFVSSAGPPSVCPACPSFMRNRPIRFWYSGLFVFLVDPGGRPGKAAGVAETEFEVALTVPPYDAVTV